MRSKKQAHACGIQKKRCKYCGKYFEPSRPTVKYCSENCMSKFYAEFYRNKRALLRGRKPVDKTTCKMCGAEFERKSPSHLFCSEACSHKRKIERYSERKKNGSPDYHPKSAALRERQYDYILCNRCEKVFRSWDKTKNRRCAQCQSDIENTYSGVDVTLLELIR